MSPTTTNLAASGPALKGDTFRARELSVVVPPTTIDMSSGFGGNWANWPIRTGGAKPQAITVTLRHDGYDDALTVGVNATAQSLIGGYGGKRSSLVAQSPRTRWYLMNEPCCAGRVEKR